MRMPKSEERTLWREAMRDVKPLRQAARAVTAASRASSEPTPSQTLPRLRGRDRVGGNAGAIGRGLDRRTALRLKRGELAIEARLDLHGLTQEEARRALDRFILRAAKAQQRLLLVITGKSGILRQAVPRWLEESESRALILAATEARPKHGGSGALYLLLRRQR